MSNQVFHVCKKVTLCLSLVLPFLLQACFSGYNSVELQRELGIKLTDTLASKETVILFYNLKKLSQKKVIFGHQHSTAYGVGWSGQPGRSDVKDVANTFPGLYGWDFETITPPNKDQYDWMKKFIMDAYKRGGINTLCWHLYNPVTGGSFYDTTIAVKHILPGGSHHNEYIKYLDVITEYTNHLVDEEGNLIPVIFRPFHEFDGSWFWWGKHFCTREEFIALWRFTVDYLRQKGVRNFLYAFSPDRNFYSEIDFMDRYPGDNYVDIIGMDNYYDFTPGGDGLDWVGKKLKVLSGIAQKKNKIAAFTETGLESIPDSLWWTKKLLKTIDSDSIQIAYVMVWRNANNKHHYAPYAGQKSEKDFMNFKNSPKILFEDRLPNLYKHPLGEEF